MQERCLRVVVSGLLFRFGIQFVASLGHAGTLLATGPVTRNIELVQRKTFDAASDPRGTLRKSPAEHRVGRCGRTRWPAADV